LKGVFRERQDAERRLGELNPPQNPSAKGLFSAFLALSMEPARAICRYGCQSAVKLTAYQMIDVMTELVVKLTPHLMV
jgi:hypothetical protein